MDIWLSHVGGGHFNFTCWSEPELCLLHMLPQPWPAPPLPHSVPARDCIPFLSVCRAVTPRSSMATITKWHHKVFWIHFTAECRFSGELPHEQASYIQSWPLSHLEPILGGAKPLSTNLALNLNLMGDHKHPWILNWLSACCRPKGGWYDVPPMAAAHMLAIPAAPIPNQAAAAHPMHAAQSAQDPLPPQHAAGLQQL